MAEPLPRLSLRELLNNTLALYREHAALFLALSALGPVAMLVYRLERIWRVLSVHPFVSPSQPRTVFDTVISMSIMASGLILCLAPVVKAVEAIRDGRETSFAATWSAVSERLWRVLGMAISVFIRAFLAGSAFILAGAFSLGLAAQLRYNGPFEAKTIGFLCGGLAILAAFAAGIEIYARYSLAPQACVMEETTGRVAMRQSRTTLTRGLHWQIVAINALCMLLTFAMNIGVALLRVLADRPTSLSILIADTLVGIVVGLLTAPLATIGLTLMYFYARGRDVGASLGKAAGI